MIQTRTTPPAINLAISHYGKTFLGETRGSKIAFFRANGNGVFFPIGTAAFVPRVGLVDLTADLPRFVRHKFEEALLN